ncbi:MAG TPA: FmdB family zinc ribbon protein [Acidimicrobiales bacterium]|nr:FmdB family zinc ribbon protein [Acidimicrobiales bacterium]
MPTYEYECQECHERLEAVQSFSDAALTICPACGGELRKVFSAVGIVFKGSGFYKTDARSTSSAAATPASDAAKKKPDAPAPATTTPAATTAPAAKAD